MSILFQSITIIIARLCKEYFILFNSILFYNLILYTMQVVCLVWIASKTKRLFVTTEQKESSLVFIFKRMKI